ncbi:hypothetical protein DEJ21_14380 [Curtobacterium sp. MCSS17_006]|nr:hypothetical protein DEJ21_14380 [Curtobacterium sp. MCSS17_006]
MTALHIYRPSEGEPPTHRGYPICGQANTYGGVYLDDGEALPEPSGEHVTCKRCIKRQEDTR